MLITKILGKIEGLKEYIVPLNNVKLKIYKELEHSQVFNAILGNQKEVMARAKGIKGKEAFELVERFLTSETPFEQELWSVRLEESNGRVKLFFPWYRPSNDSWSRKRLRIDLKGLER